MSIIDLSVKRPVTMTMLFIMVMFMGLVSCVMIPVDFLPEMDFPYLSISVQYQGYGPEEVEDSILKILEPAVSGVSGIEELSSIAVEGTAIISLEFDWGTDLDLATIDVREKVDSVSDLLPDDADSPIIQKMSTDSIPILVLGMTGLDDLPFLYDLADNTVSPQVEQAEGVAQAEVLGGYKPQIYVYIKKNRLAAYNLSIIDISNTLAVENQNLSKGYAYEGVYRYSIRVKGKYETLEDVENVVLSYKDGAPIRVKDVGYVAFGVDTDSVILRVNGKDAIGLQITKESGSNTLNAIEGVRKNLDEMKANLPPNLGFVTVQDDSEDILSSVQGVVSSAIQGAIFAMLIIFIYTWNWRSVLVIGLAIPSSILAAFIAIFAFGVTINIMSLSGLTLGVGMMVDSSIVVLDNIFYFRKQKKDAYTSAVYGAKEVFIAISASTATTCMVFIPILFVDGITGEIFRDMSITVVTALVASLLVSITMIPLLSSILYQKDLREPSNKGLEAFINKSLDALDNSYGTLLNIVLHHKKLVLTTGLVGSFVLLYFLMSIVGSEFFPAEDKGEITANLQFPVGTREEVTEKMMLQIEDEIREYSGEDIVILQTTVKEKSFFGTGQAEENKGQFYLRYVDKSERDKGIKEIAEDVRNILAKYPAITQVRTTTGMGSSFPIDINIMGADLDKSHEVGDQILELISNIDGVREAQYSDPEGGPEIEVYVNRVLASQLGLSTNSIAQAIDIGFGGRQVTRMKSPATGNDVDFLVQLADADKDNLAALDSLSIPAPDGSLVPVTSLIKIEKTTAPSQISRLDTVRDVQIVADTFGRSDGEVIRDVKKAISEKIFLPAGYTIRYEGSAKDSQEAAVGLALAFLVSLFLVYAIMAAEFESFIAPGIILLAIPFGMVGALAMIILTGKTLNVVSGVGILVLVGIVINNGIVLIDYINILLRDGVEINQAALKAGVRRLRPISMTTLTTILGLIPMALGLGQGGEIYAPLAVSVIGGLTLSTLFTLFMVPSAYAVIRKRFPLKIIKIETIDLSKEKEH